MSRRLLVSFAVLLVPVIVSAGLAAAGGVPDRLDRFRQLAITRLSLAQLGDVDRGVIEGYQELYGLLDEEIVQSLASGGPFASIPFLQDRLDGFANAWGGATLHVIRVGALVVGAFQLTDVGGAASVRVYGRLRGEPALLTTMYRDGRPSVHPLPATAQGRGQFIVAWEGAPSGWGSRHLRLDLIREANEDVTMAWSTADLFPDGLVAREYRLRGREITIRYELRYPGWIPGCEGQAEQEDVYRLASESGRFTRVSRKQFNAWHRVLHESVTALFVALAAADRKTLATLVPDPRLRARLPAQLEHDSACDAHETTGASSISVAAMTPEHRPWTLTFRRAGTAWRLVSGGPVMLP